MTYLRSYQPPSTWTSDALLMLFKGDELIASQTGDYSHVIPTSKDMPGVSEAIVESHFVGMIDSRPCFAADVPEGLTLPTGFAPCGLRALFGRVPDDHFAAAGTALQIVRFAEHHRFCGRCGTAAIDKIDERARQCPHCGLVVYPRISPAAIVAVTKGNQLLLAHARRFALPIYSTIAGFVEVGESAEECAAREVREEVGLAIRNLRYFGSQPWPLTGSLMIGFTAEYASGDIRVDGDEISDAGWYTADSLPPLPSPMSIARRLIDWFVQGQGDSLAGKKS